MMPAVALHVGLVSHLRHAPFRHRFNYRLWMLSLDLDRLGEAGSALFKVDRRAVVSLHQADHGPRDGGALRPWVEARLAAAGLARFGAGIRLMAIPRVFGYAFNPIAFYFCSDAGGRLGAVLHQVKNTFGDQTSYLLPIGGDGTRGTGEMAKRMHVSPFFDLDGGYRFALRAPDFVAGGGDFAVAIRYGHAGAARLTAKMRLATRAFGAAALLRLLLAMPLLPVTVVAAIHWQAVRLWLKGARYHPAPAHLAADDLGSVA